MLRVERDCGVHSRTRQNRCTQGGWLRARRRVARQATQKGVDESRGSCVIVGPKLLAELSASGEWWTEGVL